jgi:hypothetical protein
MDARWVPSSGDCRSGSLRASLKKMSLRAYSLRKGLETSTPADVLPDEKYSHSDLLPTGATTERLQRKACFTKTGPAKVPRLAKNTPTTLSGSSGRFDTERFDQNQSQNRPIADDSSTKITAVA